MAKRAALSFRGRARLIRAALSPTPVLKSFFNPAYVSDVSAWRSIFGGSINEWGVHGEPFATHPLVYRAITLIHNSASGVPITLSREVGAEMEPVISGVEWQALNRPSASMSRAALIGSTAGLMQCDCGESFWVVIKAGDARAIVLLNPEAVSVDQNPRTGEIVYRVTTTSGQKTLDERDVIHFKTFNPLNPLRGQGPLAAAKKTVTDDLDIRQHNRSMVRNGGLYRPVLMTDQPLPEKGSAEDSALEEQLAKMLGSPSNRGKVVILPNGLKLSEHARAAADMDYLDSRKQNVKEIAGAFGVPPSKLGDYERDQADSEAQERDYWNDTMVPILRYIADKIETDMWKITGLAKSADTGINVGFDFDTVPVLVRQKQSLWAGDTQDVQSGIVTINEVRRRRGLADVPWGDVWWSVGLPIPINSEEAPEIPGFSDPPPPTDDETGDGDEKSAAVIRLPRIVHAGNTLALERDELVLAGFVMLQSRYEAGAARAMRRVLDEIEDEVLANIRAAYKSSAAPVVRKSSEVTQLLFDLEQAAKRTRSAMRPPLRDAQMAGGKRGLRLARSSATFTVNAKPAIEYLQRQEPRFVKDIAHDTWERLRATLTDGLQRGEGEAELTTRTQKLLGVRRSEANAAAHAEVNAAANGGVELGFRQSRVVAQKRWLSALVATTRETHKRAHGQAVNVEDDFIVGGERMAFPGDPRGSDQNTYGCLCTIEPILREGP